jgi:hypothetical protein
MQAALAYADAQREYYVANPQKDKLLQYAQKFSSTQGKRDGLYYPTKAGEPRSPLGPLFDKAKAAGYQEGGGYHGYRYKILKAQGAEAKGGAQLCRAGQDDRRLCADRPARELRQHRRDELHGQPRGRGLREGPRRQHGRAGREDDEVQPGQDRKGSIRPAARRGGEPASRAIRIATKSVPGGVRIASVRTFAPTRRRPCRW